MGVAIALSGSPKAEKSRTSTLLESFLKGMADAGYETDTIHASRLDVRPCSCGEMYCWTKKPGVCCIRDDMDRVYPRVSAADVLVLAMPVYIPMPGEMQNVVNRLCPLFDPALEFRGGRTRARVRDGVGIRRLVLVSTGGWWELENFETLICICEELAATAGIDFAGAVVRPHVDFMSRGGNLTSDGQSVLRAAEKAGAELATRGAITTETLEAVHRPLISQEEYWAVWEARA